MLELLDEKSALLAPRFQPGLLPGDAGSETIFQFSFDEGGEFYLTVSNEGFGFMPGAHAAPTLTLYLDNHDTCWLLLTGRLDGMQAFMEGRYRADGNIVLSQLLLYLFSGADPTAPCRVED